jgi:hypothetical protein
MLPLPRGFQEGVGRCREGGTKLQHLEPCVYGNHSSMRWCRDSDNQPKSQQIEARLIAPLFLIVCQVDPGPCKGGRR